MKILAIDTATESGSAALYIDGEVFELYEHAPQQQANRILPMIDQLMSEASLKPVQLDAVAFGRGPGSFTGLRIAASVTQGIAFAADIPVVPVSDLQAIAQAVINQQKTDYVLAGIDARMKEIYWAAYKNESGLPVLQGKESLSDPDSVTLSNKIACIGAGSAFIPYETVLRESLGSALCDYLPDVWPHAADIAKIAVNEMEAGRTVSAEQAIPVYIRDDVAKKKAAQ